MSSTTVESNEALAIGVMLRDYSVERVLGQGGFGITYLAHDTVFDRQVAIKEFLPADIARRFGDSRVGPRATQLRESYEWGLKEFLEEAKLIDGLEHPNVVRVRNFFRDNDTAYLVMEYVPGPTLTEWLQQCATPRGDEVIALLEGLVAGVEYIHSRHCLHRDIKPDNIILRDGRIDAPVLIDFGAARKAVAERTRSIAAIVSAGYTPLEQYSSHRTLTPAMDVYALCAVAYRCITGEEPPAATERAIADEMPKLAERAGDRYEQGIVAAIDHGLALRVMDRSPDLEELRSALGIVSVPANSTPAPVETAPAKSSIERSAERDRRRQTMRVDFPAQDAPCKRADEEMPARSGQAVYPRPIWVCALAFAIGLAAYARMARFEASNIDMHALPQSLFAFPLAAFAGTWLTHRWLGVRAATPLWRALVFVVTYLSTSLFATSMYTILVIVRRGAYHDTLFDPALLLAPFTMYMSLLVQAPAEFGVFFASLAALYLGGARLRALAGPARSPLNARIALFPALLLLAFLVALPLEFHRVRDDWIDTNLPVQLRRTGYLTSDSQGAYEAAIRKVEALGVAADLHHRAVYEWVRAAATRTTYRVVADGSGDFVTIQDAIAHIARLNEEDRSAPPEIQVAPGVYRETLKIEVPLKLIGGGEAVIEADGEGAGIEFTSYSYAGKPVGAVFESFTVRRAYRPAVTPSLVTIAAGVPLRLNNNLFVEYADLDGRYSGAKKALVQVGLDSAAQYATPARVEMYGNTFNGNRGVQLASKAEAWIGGSNFEGVELAVEAAEDAVVTLANNRMITRGWGVWAHDRSKVTTRGGMVSGGVAFAAEHASRLDAEDLEIRGEQVCAMANGNATLTLTRVRLACAGYGIYAEGNGRATLVDSSFVQDEAIDRDVSSYIKEVDGGQVSLVNTTVRPR